MVNCYQVFFVVANFVCTGQVERDCYIGEALTNCKWRFALDPKDCVTTGSACICELKGEFSFTNTSAPINGVNPESFIIFRSLRRQTFENPIELLLTPKEVGILWERDLPNWK